VHRIAALAGAVCLLSLALLSSATVSASQLSAGKSYGCQINPKADACNSPVKPIVGQGGSVTGVTQPSGSQTGTGSGSGTSSSGSNSTNQGSSSSGSSGTNQGSSSSGSNSTSHGGSSTSGSSTSQNGSSTSGNGTSQGGAVSSAGTSQAATYEPAALPETGGGSNLASNSLLGISLVGFALLALGFAIRRIVGRGSGVE
jgi:hypothetical protein